MLWRALERGQYFDIIVSDYFLPGQMTGLDLWMKFADYPTLFLLNSVLEKSKLMKKIENFQDKPIFIQKPIDVDQAIDIVQTSLRKERFYAADARI